MENSPYNSSVARKLNKTRPIHGARLVELRRAAGLSQADLGRLINETQQNIAFWEQSDKPPRSDVIPKLAKVLRVSVEALLGERDINFQPPPLSSAPGPTGQVQRTFEEVRRLPRRQQSKILEMVGALVEQYKRKAS